MTTNDCADRKRRFQVEIPADGNYAIPEDRRGALWPGPHGSYAICYAVSTSPDPLGSYYRYQFVRPLFPDYPRPAVWPDGYYVTSSTGDDVIQKHAYVAERAKMLRGEPATEQGIILDDVNFLVSADLDGKELPPPGAPNIVMATGGAQLHGITEDDGIDAWKFHVDWDDPARTRLQGPVKITVAPYRYLGGGQVTRAVPQPGTERRLDAQGDKIMARLVYRRIGETQSAQRRRDTHRERTGHPGAGTVWICGRSRKGGNPEGVGRGSPVLLPAGSTSWSALALSCDALSQPAPVIRLAGRDALSGCSSRRLREPPSSRESSECSAPLLQRRCSSDRVARFLLIGLADPMGLLRREAETGQGIPKKNLVPDPAERKTTRRCIARLAS